MKLFTTEAVTKFHPDKYADQISDAIVTACMREDRNSRCGVEALVKGTTVILAGEVKTNAHNTDGNKESCLSRERVKILERCLCPTDKPRPLLL